LADRASKARSVAGSNVRSKEPQAPESLMENAIRASRYSDAFTALDDTSYGVVVLDGHGQAIFANEAAREVLDAGDALVEHKWELKTAVPSAQPVLKEIIETATKQTAHGVTGTMRLIARARRAPIIISAVPLETSAIVEAKGILLLYDVEAPTPISTSWLQQLFGLSGAECDLCVALFEGRSLKEFAQGRGVSLNTARTLLTRTFAKTSKQRQSDLIKMLASLSSMQALGAGFAAGMTAGLQGLRMKGRTDARLKLDTLTRTELDGFPDLEASVTVGEYTPGGVNKRHAHLDCLEIIFVMQGAISTEIEGEGMRITRAGEVLCLQPDIVHQGRNASDAEPAKFVIVKLKRRGAATVVAAR
jgi:quercetin dioxygenase-like cupin family protein/DNA-binding CsgD family transcriptional regulator